MFNNQGGYSLADIAAATGGERSNDGGWGEGGAWWIIILFLFVFCGWGNGGWNGNGGGAGTQGALTRGDLCMDMNFNDLQNGVRNVSDVVNLGFANLNSTICHQQYDTAAMINAMNVSNLQSANALSTQLANCCCENRQGQAQIQYDMATNTCSILNAMNTNTRDIIQSQEAGTRAILDYLCQDKISTLQNENQALRLAASQDRQNALLTSAMTAQTNQIIDRIAPYPVPAYQVPAPFGYGYNYNGYGCGCNC